MEVIDLKPGELYKIESDLWVLPLDPRHYMTLKEDKVIFLIKYTENKWNKDYTNDWFITVLMDGNVVTFNWYSRTISLSLIS